MNPKQKTESEAFETLAVLLQALCDAGEELGEGPELEDWVAHLQNPGLVPPPGGRLPGDPEGHNWSRLRQRLPAIIANMGRDNDRMVSEMRETFSTFSQSLVEALAQDREDNIQVRDVLQNLRSAAQTHSFVELRQEAVAAVDVVQSALEQRENRYEQQVRELAEHARSLEGRLHQARAEQLLDALTGLQNRRSFDLELAAAGATTPFDEWPAALLLFDIDHFKRVNDTYGHLVGDVVLKSFADTLLRCFPQDDSFVARYGGEEFAAILYNCDMDDAIVQALHCMNQVRVMQVDVEGASLPLSCSAGVTVVRRGDSPTSLVARADRALYSAKRDGRDRVANE